NTQNPNPKFNGNVGAVLWRATGAIQNYQYNYDNRNQLVEASYYAQQSNGTYAKMEQHSVPSIDYDLNGNVLSLQRSLDATNFKDNLLYHYDDANHLIALEEFGDLSQGFESNLNMANYQYDNAGNMVYDGHKGLSISYNQFNLPDTMVFATNDSIIIFYEASGLKFKKKIINSNGVVSFKYYINGIEYNDTNMEAVYFQDARVVTDGNAYNYEYILKDHLGNSRVHFSDLDHNGEIDKNTEVLQQQDYYPFGMVLDNPNAQVAVSENHYQYNGKEMNDEFGLNWLDYGARWYDPSIGRWTVIDKLAEHPSQLDLSPYASFWNNPATFNDPDGNCPWCIPVVAAFLTGAATEAGVQVVSQVDTKKSFMENVEGIELDGTDIVLGGAFNTITPGGGMVRAVGVSVAESTTKQLVNVYQEDQESFSGAQVFTDAIGDRVGDGVGRFAPVPVGKGRMDDLTERANYYSARAESTPNNKRRAEAERANTDLRSAATKNDAATEMVGGTAGNATQNYLQPANGTPPGNLTPASFLINGGVGIQDNQIKPQPVLIREPVFEPNEGGKL
ncbi:MAG: RHS repeat-associated core domain-containing protein, partial [Flavobacteriales bacterium]|nr:RHS repeat-associated core domain-containing protein [Flavobacteriales bacterium]